MKLLINATSPFSRLVLITIKELNIQNVKLNWVYPWTSPEDLILHNPFCLVPTIIFDNGESLFESQIICEYLIKKYESNLGDYFEKGEKHLAISKLLLETSFKIVMLNRFNSLQNKDLESRMINSIERALKELSKNWERFTNSPITFAHLSLAVALDYITFRLNDKFILPPALDKWLEKIKKRPSFKNTTVEILTNMSIRHS